MTGTSPDVLVVGAGPTGLTAALQAHDHGADVRIIERRVDRFRPSRAMLLHPRALECLRPLGVTEALLDRADRHPSAQLHLGRHTVTARLGDVALHDTAFPHLTLVRQADVEDVLTTALHDRGVRVERGTELVPAPAHGGGRAHVLLRTGRGREEASPRYVAGCDGPDSTVRGIAGVEWRGGPYREEVVLADVELDGTLTPGVLHAAPGRAGLLFLFALGEAATWRVLGTRPARDGAEPFGQAASPVPVEEVQRLLDDAGLPARIRELAWSARVRLQHRLARSFRHGRLFLAGDAAHAHSPAAAQGMNSGILDAANLGWKLAYARDDEGAHATLLDSYDRERRPVAAQVLALTHAVFFAEASTHPLAAFGRSSLVPLAAPLLPRLLAEPHLMAVVVRLLSQRWVRYRRSPLSRVGPTCSTRGPRPGDRLPDETVRSDGRTVLLHDLTAAPGVHLLLERVAGVTSPRRGPRITVHRIDSWPGSGVVAVRPDGHVGYRSASVADRGLRDWLALVGAAGPLPRG